MTTVSLSKRESVGVIGLGIMGSAMASHLAKAGFAVYGVDVSPVARKKMSRLLSHVDADLEGSGRMHPFNHLVAKCCRAG
jgi:3-hydroxyacyl-CoA dehydrogenase